ncbi:MAG: hypothetical protein GY795_34100 [Desulfobacterales bacterium]|nr:hypothetical protein [Desulfobacterales bacterium]
MKAKSLEEVERFVANQKDQLGLDDTEAQSLYKSMLDEDPDQDAGEGDYELDLEELDPDLEEETSITPPQLAGQAPASPGAFAEKQSFGISPRSKRGKQRKQRRKIMKSDPYLSDSQTIRARPTRVSKIRSLFYEHALPNEYIVQIGVKDPKPVLGGKFFKLGKRFLKFPAAVQTVYFTSDNANKNYQGLRIDGYACWRVSPERPEVAARSLDFSDQANPMGNTNRILRTICTEAIRHIIANISIEDSLTKKDEIGRDLKAQLERIERSWGVIFDQIGIERVTILSSSVFDDLQQKTRDQLRLTASESRMETDLEIEKKKAGHTKEIEALRCTSEKEARILSATTESEIHKVELDEKAKRESEERKADEARKKAQNETAERSAEQKAEQVKRQAVRDSEVETLKADEEHKLKLAKAASEGEIKIKAAETDAGVAEALANSEMIKAQAEHSNLLKAQELEAERKLAGFEKEHQLNETRVTAQLQMAEKYFDQSIKQQREQAQAEHEADVKRLDRLKTEEAIKNLISENRVLARFTDKLPEIMASFKIDRYTVFDNSGTSPLIHSLAQVFSVLEEHGLKKFLEKEREE